jgi:hypothetical protein
MLLCATIVCLVAVPLAGLSQVQSLTLGVDVNSPYGLSEPWYTIRNALVRCDDLQTVAEQPDRKAATAQVTPKGGRLPDLVKLETAIRESGAGATLRGVEATIEGLLISTDGKWLLRGGGNEFLLQPLTRLVQQERKKLRPPAPEELNAYERLLASQSKRVRVTGPLRMQPRPVLEVRIFEKAKTK